MPFWMYIILLGITKIFDNVIMSWKSIVTYREQKILSSVLTTTSQLMFYFIIKQIVSDSTILLIVVISITSGIGNYLGFFVSNKFKKSSKWTNIITSSDSDGMFDLNDYLVKHDIKCVLTKSLNRNKQDSFTLIIFANTKDQSKLIDKYFDKDNMKYLREILR